MLTVDTERFFGDFEHLCERDLDMILQDNGVVSTLRAQLIDLQAQLDAARELAANRLLYILRLEEENACLQTECAGYKHQIEGMSQELIDAEVA